jgi:hypothetical protein
MDLLRAMLVFASSGLDSMVKQLALDVLPSIIRVNSGAKDALRGHIEKRLRRGEGIDSKYLSAILTEQDSLTYLIDDLVESIRESSAQSKEQLLKIAAHFDIPANAVCPNPNEIQNVFDARNEISHEMDVDFGQPNRSRRPRPRDTMMTLTNRIFDVANRFLQQVDQRMR